MVEMGRVTGRYKEDDNLGNNIATRDYKKAIG